MDDQDAQAADVNHEDLLGRRLIVKEHDGLPFGFRITETRWAKMHQYREQPWALYRAGWGDLWLLVAFANDVHKLQALMASLEAK